MPASGARGYLLKKIDQDYLLRAIRSAYNGESIIAPQMMTKFVNRFADPEPRNAQDMEMTALTRRERQTLAWLARGVSNKEIARAMNLAESTVKVHVQSCLRKLGLRAVFRPPSTRRARSRQGTRLMQAG